MLVFIARVLFLALCLQPAGSLRAEEKANRFRSEHFQFVADTVPSPSTKKTVIEAAEATRELLAPWIRKRGGVLTVRLFRSEAAFVRAGGIPGSGGVHCSESGEVLLRIDGDGLSDEERRVLIHEVTHQCLDTMLEAAPPWLVEGVAVYVESIPFHAGRFQEDWVCFRRAPLLHGCPRNHIETVRLATLLRADRRAWNANFRVNPHGVNRHYQTAYLLTYHLIHFQAEPGPHPLRQFLAALDEALQASGSPEQVLRSGRYQPSLDECHALETDFIRAFEAAGLTLTPLTGYRLLP